MSGFKRNDPVVWTRRAGTDDEWTASGVLKRQYGDRWLVEIKGEARTYLAFVEAEELAPAARRRAA